MSLKGLADYDQHGRHEAAPKWPFRCEFRPRDPCNYPDAWHGSYLDTLTTGECIHVGQTLWDVWCLENPEGEPFFDTIKKIGEIVTTSELVTSMYGDTKLFFRHVRFEEDLEARPEWFDHVELFVEPTFVENLPLPLDAPEACPFDYLFGMM